MKSPISQTIRAFSLLTAASLLLACHQGNSERETPPADTTDQQTTDEEPDVPCKSDSDKDGTCDNVDLCVGLDAAGDTDADGVCNDRDACDGDDFWGDSDEDGICDDRDLCRGTDQWGDSDGDGVCEDQDACQGDDALGDADTNGECDDPEKQSVPTPWISISPELPRGGDVVTARLEYPVDLDDYEVRYSWTKDGKELGSNSTLEGVARGESWTLTVTLIGPNQVAASRSLNFTVQNALPRVENVHMADGACGVDAKCLYDYTDGDGDPDESIITWFVNDTQVESGVLKNTLSVSNVSPGDLVECVVSPRDGQTDEASDVSSSPKALDAAPVVRASALGGGRVGEPLTCDHQVSDECSGLEYSVDWYLNGSFQASGADLDTSGLALGGMLVCRIEATDASGQTTIFETAPLQVTSPTWRIRGSEADGGVGRSVAPLLDGTGNGLGRIVVGVSGYDLDTGLDQIKDIGAVYVVDVRTDGETVYLSDFDQGEGGERILGESGSYSVDELVCGNYYFPAGCPTIREPYEDYDATREGPEGGAFGLSLTGGGDFTGDGIPDFIASAPYALTTDVWTGRTYTFSGSVSEFGSAGEISDGTSGFVVSGECGRRAERGGYVGSEDVEADGDVFGWSLEAAGDVNGDGIDDFIVGAPNNGDQDEGTAYVVYGHDRGEELEVADLFSRGCEIDSEPKFTESDYGFALAGTDEKTILGGSLWGVRVNGAGDFNGDGYADVFAEAEQFRTPRYWVYFGGHSHSPTNLDATSGEENAVELRHPPSGFGCSGGTCTTTGLLLNTAAWGSGGDINGDQLDDVVAWGFGEEGIIGAVIYGQKDATKINISSVLEGDGGFPLLGETRAPLGYPSQALILGDMNGDGYDDFALGAPATVSTRGTVLVFFGGKDITSIDEADLENGIGGFVLHGDTNGDRLGMALSSGDVDGDGLADLLMGAPGVDDGESDVGEVVVYFGGNVSGTITHYGHESDDELVGSSDVDHMVGGRGNDTIRGNGGADAIYGGGGDDTVFVADLSFRRIDAGIGEDTVVFSSTTGDISLAELRHRLFGIEVIQLEGQALTLPVIDVLNLSKSTNRLRIEGSGELLTLPGEDWIGGSAIEESGKTYRVIQLGRAELWIEEGVETSIAPTVLESEFTVAENSAAGTYVGQVEATDPDGTVQDYFLSSQSHDGHFFVSSTGAVFVDTAAVFDEATQSGGLDFEGSEQDYWVAVGVTDDQGLTTVKTFPIHLSDVNEVPFFPQELSDTLNGVVSATVFTVLEGGATGASFGTLRALDVDADDSITYSISGSIEGLDPSNFGDLPAWTVSGSSPFEVDADSGALSLSLGNTLDYEGQQTYWFELVATDQLGLSTKRVILVRVSDRDSIDTITSTTFTLSDQSMMMEDDSSLLDFLEVFTGGGYAQVFDPGDTSGDFSLPWITGATIIGSRYVPTWGSRDFSYDMSGDLSLDLSVDVDTGSLNATAPITINLSVPDEVSPDTDFTLSSSWAFDGQPTLTGQSPYASIDLDFHTNLDVSASTCLDSSCKSVKKDIDLDFNQNWTHASNAFVANKWKEDIAGSDVLPTKTYADYLEDAFEWSASEASTAVEALTDYSIEQGSSGSDALATLIASYDSVSAVSLTDAPITTVEILDTEWNSYFVYFLNKYGGGQGLTRGTWESSSDGINWDIDYFLFDTTLNVTGLFSYEPTLVFLGLEGEIEFEDGSTQTFTVGEDTTLNVSAAQDLDNDGAVSTTIQISMNTVVMTDMWHMVYGGLNYTFFEFEATGKKVDDGTKYGPFTYGPVEVGCGIYSGANFSGASFKNSAASCLATLGHSYFYFQPQKWTVQEITGSIDLKP